MNMLIFVNGRITAETTIPLNAATEPTDKSIPPEIITKVIPVAIKALMDI